MKKFSKNRGFIKMIILVVAALVLIKYTFDIDVVGFFTTGKPKLWLDKAYDLATTGWQKYKDFIVAVWNYSFEFGKNLWDKFR